MTMKRLMMVAAAVLWTGSALAEEDVRLFRIPNAAQNNATTTPWVDADVNLNRDTPTAGSKGFATRVGVTDLRLTTGDSTTGIQLSAFNETGTRIVDTSTPVRGLRFYMSPKYGGATHYEECSGCVALVGISAFGKTAANLRQGYLPVTMRQPLVIENVFWYNTTGSSVSIFIECNNANAALQGLSMQVIR